MTVMGAVLMLVGIFYFINARSLDGMATSVMHQTYAGLNDLHATLAFIGGAICFGVAGMNSRLARLQNLLEGIQRYSRPSMQVSSTTKGLVEEAE